MNICLKMKKQLLLCLMILTIVGVACGFDSAAQKVYDDADLLSDTEEETLKEFTAAAQRAEQDLIVVTTADSLGKSAMAYADDFYDEHGFGYEKTNGSGVLFLIDMDNREIYISTAGTAIEQYTDMEIDRTLDRLMAPMADGDYYGACTEFIQAAEECLTGGDTAQNGHYDADTDRFVEKEQIPLWKQALAPQRLFANFMVALVISAVAVFFIGRKRKTKMSVGNHTYLKNGRVSYRERSDRFTHTTVVTRHIPKDNIGSGGGHSSGGGFSSSHVSSGGHSHGGGGRSF